MPLAPPFSEFSASILQKGFRDVSDLSLSEKKAFYESGWGVAVNNPLMGGVIADASFLHIKPAFLFRPISIDQIKIIVSLALKFHIPLTVASGKTGLSGGYANPGIILDLDGLITLPEPINVSMQNRVVVVDQAVLVSDLIDHIPQITQNQFIFPVQPSSAFKLPVRVGGLIGSDASGVTSGKLGSIINWIESMRILTPTGEIREIHKTDNDYPNMVGQNGRFGIVLNATIRLFATPSNLRMVLLFGSDLAGVLQGLQKVQNERIFPLTSEFILSEANIRGRFSQYFGTYKDNTKWAVLLKGTENELVTFEDTLRQYTDLHSLPQTAKEFKILLEERTSLALQSVADSTTGIYVTFPGFEDVLVAPDKMILVLNAIGSILTSYHIEPIKIGYGHLNFRQGRGMLLHIRLPLPLDYWSDRCQENTKQISSVIAEVNLTLKDRFGILPKAEHTQGILYPWLNPEKMNRVRNAILKDQAFYDPAIQLWDDLCATIPNYVQLSPRDQFTLALFHLLAPACDRT